MPFVLTPTSLTLLVAAALLWWADPLLVWVRRSFPSPSGKPGSTGARLLEAAAADLSSPDPERILRATRLLESKVTPGTATVLAWLLHHPEREVAQRAAFILYRWNDEAAIGILTRFLAARPAAPEAIQRF